MPTSKLAAASLTLLLFSSGCQGSKLSQITPTWLGGEPKVAKLGTHSSTSPNPNGNPSFDYQMAQLPQNPATAEPTSIVDQLNRGHAEYAQGQLAQAKASYEKVLAASPNHTIAHHRLAVIADQQQNFGVAEQHYQAALASATGRNNPDLLSDYGYSCLLQGRYVESETYLKSALQLYPNHRTATNNLGVLAGMQGKYDQALAIFRQTGNEQEAQAKMAQLFPKGRPNMTEFPGQNQLASHETPGSFNPASSQEQPSELTMRLKGIMEQERLNAIRAREMQQGQNSQLMYPGPMSSGPVTNPMNMQAQAPWPNPNSVAAPDPRIIPYQQPAPWGPSAQQQSAPQQQYPPQWPQHSTQRLDEGELLKRQMANIDQQGRQNAPQPNIQNPAYWNPSTNQQGTPLMMPASQNSLTNPPQQMPLQQRSNVDPRSSMPLWSPNPQTSTTPSSAIQQAGLENVQPPQWPRQSQQAHDLDPQSQQVEHAHYQTTNPQAHHATLLGMSAGPVMMPTITPAMKADLSNQQPGAYNPQSLTPPANWQHDPGTSVPPHPAATMNPNLLSQPGGPSHLQMAITPNGVATTPGSSYPLYPQQQNMNPQQFNNGQTPANNIGMHQMSYPPGSQPMSNPQFSPYQQQQMQQPMMNQPPASQPMPQQFMPNQSHLIQGSQPLSPPASHLMTTPGMNTPPSYLYNQYQMPPQ